MNLKERRRYDMLMRAQAFGKRRARAFPPCTAGGNVFAELGDIIAEVSEQDASRRSCEAGLRVHTRDRLAARRALRASLLAIHRTALAIAISARVKHRTPPLPRTRGDRAWIVAARASAQHARESAEAFVTFGLPVTFLDDLAADIARLEQTILNGAAARHARATARAQIQQTLRKSLGVLRQLDAIVPNVLHGDPSALAPWHSARRLLRIPKRRAKHAKAADHLDGASALGYS
jgi:hypothetical protein